MEQEKQLQNNISQFIKGLHTDNSHVDSPKGTYRFALNSVNETELGDSGFISNEESNEICGSITPGFIPLGKVYLGNNKICILSVAENEPISEIGIFYADECRYEVHVNDSLTPRKEKLNFNKEYQIQATYRLRRGCEDTIYFTDGFNPPRYFNFGKPEQFQSEGVWMSSKFSLYKSIKSLPKIRNVEVLDSYGSLIPGSYTILVQHLDEDFNGTEFHEIVSNINIYNDAIFKSFPDIDGSGNIGQDGSPYKSGVTNKAIKIDLKDIDENFTYVRYAFVERISGNGLVTSVKYSEPLSVLNPLFIYTGQNASTTGTIEEVELFNINSGIKTAKHVEQIDNMLILANVGGEDLKLCKLQRYASKIQTDCFVKDTILTSTKEKHNAKNPLVYHNGIGYQPGEIYSLGINYIFDDYTISPTMHIPGKSLVVSNSHVFSPASGVYPMSNIKNTNISEKYLDENTSCDGLSYWGIDSQGTTLRGSNVRHHRFPTRDAVGVDFVKRVQLDNSSAEFKSIQVLINNNLKKTIKCDPEDTNCTPYTAKEFKLTVKYKRNGFDESFFDVINPDNSPPTSIQSNIFINSDTITDIKIYYEDNSTAEYEILLNADGESIEQSNGALYKVLIGTIKEDGSVNIYKVPIFGLKFSNIQLPTEEEIGRKVIGYQIVRQERRDIDKTILDTAVITPMLKSSKNVSTAMLAPQFQNGPNGAESMTECTSGNDGICYNTSKRNVNLITPLHKFTDRTFDGFTTIEEVGKYGIESISRSVYGYQNIFEGTSASGDETKYTKDNDGFTLRHATRFTGVQYQQSGSTKFFADNQDTRMYNLEGINYSDNENGEEVLYNLSADNKALILSSTKNNVDLRTYRPGKREFPYVYIKKDHLTFYQNFRNNPYYLASTEVFNTPTCQVFGGDTFVVPMRYSNHIFANAVAAIRRKKQNVWQIIGSIFVALVGIALAVFSGSTSLVIAGGIIAALGGIATGAATILETAKFNELYGEKWEKNLDRTVFDYFYSSVFIKEYPEKTWEDYLYWRDDTFRWFGDILGDLWFETNINVSLRVPPTNMENNYLKPLKPYMSDRQDKVNAYWHGVAFEGAGIGGSDNYHYYGDIAIGAESPDEMYFIKKICVPDNSNASGFKYTGMSVPQIYLINPDHAVFTSIKKYYTIPLSYDCCSDCSEKYPHRIHYSQQSFQEEKSDNYRIFLPNNYRDIEGETGEITNIFRLYNNLFAHTGEALWRMGRNYQERVTDNIVSFIGTGSYFEIPPQKVIDDDTGNSAGTQHKWSGIKTPIGYFFVSANQKRIYQFDGSKLTTISDIGISNWFKNNIEININRDNPSNPLGSGYVSTYDSRKERIIFTKIDKKLPDNILLDKDLYCDNIIFRDYKNIISDKNSDGWVYNGLENCKMKFSKKIIVETIIQEPKEIYHEPIIESIPNPNIKWLKFVRVRGTCLSEGGGPVEQQNKISDPQALPPGGGGGCTDYTSIEDMYGNIHYIDSFHSGVWVEDLYVENWVTSSTLVEHNSDSEIRSTVYNYDDTKIFYNTTVIQEGYTETIMVDTIVYNTEEIFSYVEGEITDDLPKILNKSWTISFSLKNNTWVSWHSYIPNFYFNIPERFFSWKHGNDNLWQHNVIGNFQTFYGDLKPHILEYVSVSNPVLTRIWNTLMLQTEAKEYNFDLKEYVDERYITFNKAVLYNSRQCSGLMDLIVKDTQLGGVNYLLNQTLNNTNSNTSVIDRTEKNWFINDFRDIRVDYTKPIWNNASSSLQQDYFIDKVLNTSTLDIEKDWTQLESFRDKYLVVRLIFDNFANKKLITNFSVENEQQSFH